VVGNDVWTVIGPTRRLPEFPCAEIVTRTF
jgi:hypothetical protein